MKVVCVLLFVALALADPVWYHFGDNFDSVEVPAEWTCPDSWFAENRNSSDPAPDCDCGCGAFDPDCDYMVDAESATLYNGFVPAFAMRGGFLYCGEEQEEPTNTEWAFCHGATAECEVLPPNPWATHCPPEWYNEVGFGDETPDCDCNCLIYDIDCAWEDEIVSTFCSDYSLEGEDPEDYICTGDATCVDASASSENGNGGDTAENIINFNFAGMIQK